MKPNYYEVIDDFLPLNEFNELSSYMLPFEFTENPQLPWYYIPAGNVVKGTSHFDRTIDWRLFYLSHVVYRQTITSPFYEKIIPHCWEQLNIKSLIRIKINMYPNTETLKEHGMHTDYNYPHKASILYINTCDGYTKFEDGTKIDSVANRMLIFDGSKHHTSSTTTDQPVRMNINFNYF
jgi:hypothetical protein